MKAPILSSVILLLLSLAKPAWSTDACSSRAIQATAEVTVSDGSSFKIESFFHSKDAAAIRHIYHDDSSSEVQTIAVDGPYGWVRRGDRQVLGEGFHKSFALGHQFHALLLYFDDIANNVIDSASISYQGTLQSAKSGDYPYKGRVHLIASDVPAKPAGILLELPDTPPIAASFDDWRPDGDTLLPFHVRIDDGERLFDYRYTSIATAPQSPLWFFKAVLAPAIDQLQVYRLHRQLLAAHCLGDADLIAALSAPEMLIAGGGELDTYSNDSVREQFAGLFQRRRYTEYHDLVPPVVEIAQGLDIGWIGVEVRAAGSDIESGATFSDQWSWLMLVRKIDGNWLHAGNASNRAR